MSLAERNEKILYAYKMWTPAKVIARKYGLTQSTIQKIAFKARVGYGSQVGVKILDIAKIASQLFNVSMCDVLSNKRNSKIIIVRFAIYVVARKLGFSYSAIGRRMNKDHSTIMGGVRRASEKLIKDENFKKMTEILTNAINETQTRTRCAGSD